MKKLMVFFVCAATIQCSRIGYIDDYKYIAANLSTRGIIQINDTMAIDKNEVSLTDFLEFSSHYDSALFVQTHWLNAVSPFFVLDGTTGIDTTFSLYLIRQMGLNYLNTSTVQKRFYPISNIRYEDACRYCDSVTKVLSKEAKFQLKKIDISGDLPTLSEQKYISTTSYVDRGCIGLDYFSETSYKYTDSVINQRLSSSPYMIKNTANLNNVSKRDYFFTEFNGVTYLASFWNNDLLVYAKPTIINNKKKIYNLYGNVSEMVKEKGIAVGGSFRDSIKDCNSLNIEHYEKPQYWIGFRCIYKLKKKN